MKSHLICSNLASYSLRILVDHVSWLRAKNSAQHSESWSNCGDSSTPAAELPGVLWETLPDWVEDVILRTWHFGCLLVGWGGMSERQAAEARWNWARPESSTGRLQKGGDRNDQPKKGTNNDENPGCWIVRWRSWWMKRGGDRKDFGWVKVPR